MSKEDEGWIGADLPWVEPAERLHQLFLDIDKLAAPRGIHLPTAAWYCETWRALFGEGPKSPRTGG